MMSGLGQRDRHAMRKHETNAEIKQERGYVHLKNFGSVVRLVIRHPHKVYYVSSNLTATTNLKRSQKCA